MKDHLTMAPSAKHDEPSCLAISQGLVLYCTQKAAQLFGYGSYEIIGLPLVKLLPHLHMDCKSPVVLGRHRDGSALWLNLEMTKIPFLHATIMLFLEDVTECKLDEIATMSTHRYREKMLRNSSCRSS